MRCPLWSCPEQEGVQCPSMVWEVKGITHRQKGLPRNSPLRGRGNSRAEGGTAPGVEREAWKRQRASLLNGAASCADRETRCNKASLLRSAGPHGIAKRGASGNGSSA